MEKNLTETTKYSVKHWWISLLVGILAVIVGIMSSLEPLVTISILTLFFIASFLVSGLFDIAFAISNRKQLSQWGWVLAGGIISLVFAIILVVVPIVSMAVFIFYVAFFIMIQSLIGIWASITLKKSEGSDWWVFLLVAIFGFVLSLIMIFKLDFAANFITIVFSVSLICYGLFRIFYSFRLKKVKDLFEI